MNAQPGGVGLLNDEPQQPAGAPAGDVSPKALALANDPDYLKSRVELAQWTLANVDLAPQDRESWQLYLDALTKKLTALLGAPA